MALYRNKVLVSGIRDYPAMTWAEYQALPVAQRPKKWICTDRDYTEIPRESVSITADGTGTYNTLLNSFFNLIDESKLSPTSYLTFQNQIYHVVDISLGFRHIFIRPYFVLNNGKSQNWQIELRPSQSALVQQNGDGNVIDYSSYPPNVGDTLTLYY